MELSPDVTVHPIAGKQNYDAVKTFRIGRFQPM